jgi:hypothetical protein
MDLGEIGWGVEWIQLAQDRGWWRAVVSSVTNVQVQAPRKLRLLVTVTLVCTSRFVLVLMLYSS